MYIYYIRCDIYMYTGMIRGSQDKRSILFSAGNATNYWTNCHMSYYNMCLHFFFVTNKRKNNYFYTIFKVEKQQKVECGDAGD